MRPRAPYLDDKQRTVVRAWWTALQPRDEQAGQKPSGAFTFNRGDRAVLRRAAEVDDLVLASASSRLAQALLALEACKEWRRIGDDMAAYRDIALVAGLLAHVKVDLPNDGRSLAWWLGMASVKARAAASGAPVADRPLMSELRFKRLLKATGSDEIYRQLLRAIKIAGERADVGLLADDVLALLSDVRRPPVNPTDSLKLYWAHDYYLNAKDQAAFQSESNKESDA
ncbi:type I-E CRISPR-associated protein Cse2/CasB [Orrella sp. JC864]|uniref:type I-E CRISPR-associated protein Cse2/CasB n=1 Tax=Orrella sp. JC864 TaxID=3120298 RepID=UPI00300AA9F0